MFSSDGELIAQGCNEVPRAMGGTYWDLEEPDYRDVRIGYDPNEDEKEELLREVFERLGKHGLLSEAAQALGSSAQIVASVTRKAKNSDDPKSRNGALVGTAILDLTEFGRIVHAEMCAICDAARLGRGVKGATLFCTTFPCHNCTKHIVASGIIKVVFMEPYPKSRAKTLHKHEIEIERASSTKVSFMPFMGISPLRYRDIFQKGKRKSSNGKARQWYADDNIARPMLDVILPAYPELEQSALGDLVGSLSTDAASEER